MPEDTPDWTPREKAVLDALGGFPPGLEEVLHQEIFKPQGPVHWDCGCDLNDSPTGMVYTSCVNLHVSDCAIAGFMRGAAVRRRFDKGEF
jgi:hypothetical protein